MVGFHPTLLPSWLLATRNDFSDILAGLDVCDTTPARFNGLKFNGLEPLPRREVTARGPTATLAAFCQARNALSFSPFSIPRPKGRGYVPFGTLQTAS